MKKILLIMAMVTALTGCKYTEVYIVEGEALTRKEFDQKCEERQREKKEECKKEKKKVKKSKGKGRGKKKGHKKHRKYN
ncbi:hypothetical protein PM10SUCC1_17830 [Propionigenium maris DSM 9537]|uniref:Lipoprotein n=1 Tax=Propionigenium maris DSM 9537 TaxID=1123000 RepID=A0A9W6LMW8_9FUSO|nr:hypothetical protein [Propionigenium maris]GLI56269.1 hypothetical protein PM10SUCC1_17830 [Propionigenium maris DSM 9537]